MTISKLKISGAFLVSNPVYTDSRGAFQTNWESADLKSVNVDFTPVSACHSYNIKAGTLRGMHYQASPYDQAKMVSCVAGKVYDVLLDLRPASPTYLMWDAVELSADSGESVFIPAGCAHGFLTLADHTIVFYLIEGDYVPGIAGTVRWNDPAIGINWPIADPILSDRDKNAPDFKP